MSTFPSPQIVPRSGLAGNTSTKNRPDPEFIGDDFSNLIENKGYRLCWSRATECPCVNTNDQTRSPDPNCVLCKSTGWLYFSPTEAILATNVGVFTDTQEAIITNNGGKVIRGVITGLQNNRVPYGQIGNWLFGDSLITVRAGNIIGFYDKLINLDSQIVYSEAQLSSGPGTVITTRYMPIQVNLVRSFTTVYVANDDFTLNAGVLSFLPGKGPATGTKLSLHYLTCPTWLVIEHPHSVRASTNRRKVINPMTPQGNPLALPLQGHCRLEFIPNV